MLKSAETVWWTVPNSAVNSTAQYYEQYWNNMVNNFAQYDEQYCSTMNSTPSAMNSAEV